jgi:hypothetical protein
MAEQADEDTAGPELPMTEQAEMAWSAADDADDLLTGLMAADVPQCPRVFAVCVAVAGVITVVDRHWFSDWRAGRPAAAQFVSSPPRNPPEATIPAPSYTPVPAAEHLQPPAPTGPVADANYLTGLQQTGLTVSSTSFAIANGHNIRGSPAEGHTTEQTASLVMRRSPAWRRFMPTEGLPGHRRLRGQLAQLRKESNEHQKESHRGSDRRRSQQPHRVLTSPATAAGKPCAYTAAPDRCALC